MAVPDIRQNKTNVPSLVFIVASFVRTRSTKRSVIPEGRHATKGVTVDRYAPNGWERQVRGHQQLAGRRQLPQKTDPDAHRFLGVVFEAVVPVGVFESSLEHGVANERHPL